MNKTVNCLNDFYESKFNELCAELENGHTIETYIDCIGHNKNNNVQEIYSEKLFDKYGERLIKIINDNGYSYTYTYSLK